MARSIEAIITPETGKLLREAREARNLSIEDAASRLKLHPQYIMSMEAGDLRKLPPGPYRKAFLYEYAKFLRVKPESLAAEIAEEENMISQAVSAVPGVAKKVGRRAARTTESAFKKVEEGVKEAVEEITARELWQEADEVRNERLGIAPPKEEISPISVRPENPSPPEPLPEYEAPPARESRRARRLALQEQTEYQPAYEPEEAEDDMHPGMSRATKMVVGLLVLIAAIVGYSVLTKRSNVPTAPEPEQKSAAKQQPVVRPTPLKKDTTATAAALPNDSLIFTITAKDTVWVSITPDIGNSFRGKLSKGETKRFVAKDKYILYLGNQHAVSMTLGGNPVGNLPTVPGSNIVVRNAVLERGKLGTGNQPLIASKNQMPNTQQNQNQPPKKKISPGFKPIKPVPPILPQ